MLFDGGVGVLRKVSKAYMGRWLCRPILPVAEHDLMSTGSYRGGPNVGAKLPNMLWVVVVLLWQHDDQLKIRWT